MTSKCRSVGKVHTVMNGLDSSTGIRKLFGGSLFFGVSQNPPPVIPAVAMAVDTEPMDDGIVEESTGCAGVATNDSTGGAG